MTSGWRETLAEVDPAAAAVLSSCKPGLPVSFTIAGDEPAREWLGRQYPGPNVILVPGALQAGWILPLLRSKDSLTILLLDRDVQRLTDALDCLESHDAECLCTMISAQRFVVDPGESEDRSTERFLQAADFSRRPCIRLLDIEGISAADYQMVLDVTKPARELIRFQACDLATRIRFGPEWQSQGIRNIPSIIRQASVRSLSGAFEGMPALVIGAGPSAAELVDVLRLVHRRCVVLCVGRALNFVLHNKILPNMIVTGDGQKFVKNHLKYKPAGWPVVASFFTDPETVAGLDKVFFCEMESMNLPTWLREKVGPLGEIFPGGNVATAAMSLAVEMGCNPVMTVGVDFCYQRSGKMHATGKLKEDFGGQTLYDVPGNYEETVKTNRQMYHYIGFLSEWIGRHPETTFINVNNGGARIEGMKLIRPEEIEQYVMPEGIRHIAVTRINEIYENETRENRVPGCLASLQADLPVLQSLHRQCLDAAMVCNQLIMLVRQPGLAGGDPEGRLNALLAQLTPLDLRLKDDAVMNLLESRLESATHMLSERMLSTQELRLSPSVRSHKRWREFYMQVAAACKETESELVLAIERLKEIDLAIDDTVVEPGHKEEKIV